MLTELNAINTMLRAIGQSPVTSVGIMHPHVILARDVLAEHVLAVQSMGLWFNEEYGLRLLPNDEGHIILPGNVQHVDPVELNVPGQTLTNLVQRGTKLYDPVNHTFAINQPVTVNLRVELPFEELPTVVQLYVQAAAAYEFHSDVLGDQAKMQRLETKRNRAFIEMKQKDIITRNVNAMTSPGAAATLGRIRPVR